MKDRDIENLKKSKVFHQYSIKFHTFLEWKQYVRRTRTTKDRALTLEAKTKASVASKIMSQMKEKIGKLYAT